MITILATFKILAADVQSWSREQVVPNGGVNLIGMLQNLPCYRLN